MLQISSGLIAISQANINSNNKLKENIRVLSKKANAVKLLKEEGGKIIVCTKNSIDDSRVICIDGVSIALEILKLPITNTVILGAIAAVCDSVELEDLYNAVNQNMSPKLRDVNCKVIEKAYKTIKERV